MQCSIANPLSAGHSASLNIRLDMQNAAPSIEPMNITVQANTLVLLIILKCYLLALNEPQ